MGQSKQTIVSGQYLVSPRTLSFVMRGDDVLLLRGASNKRTWPNQYNGVGGHVRADEDVFAAARREIAEETGLQVRDLRLRGVINIPVDRQDAGVLLFVFTATSATGDLRPSDEGKPEWVRRDAIDQVDLVEDLPVLLPHVLAMGTEDPPFFALYDYGESDELVATFASIAA